MVSLNPVDEPIDENIIQPAHAEEDTFGEEYFPAQMSWYAPEGPQGLLEDAARKVRENPWLAMGIAVAAGVAVAMLAGPLLRAGVAGLEMATRHGSEDADGSGDESRDDCPCDDDE